jgi:hypothetical protein
MACSSARAPSDQASPPNEAGTSTVVPDATTLADARAETGTPTDATGANDAAAPGDGAAAVDATTSADAGLADGSGGDASDGVAGDAMADCDFGDAGESIELRCTGLYSDWASKTVSADLQEYDPGLHLWSDGAVKTRWIYLPPGADGGRAPIDTSDMDEWTFPIGTKVWKEFVLGGKRVETRLIWKQADNLWYLTTYLWSPDGESSATELTTGELDADGHGYEVPTQSACPQCHNGRLDKVLGFEAVALSSAGATPVTLQTLAASGWITEPPEAGIVIPGNTTDVAALGYLHANCGIACHNRGSGAAEGTGFFMRLEVADMATVQATDTWQTGVGHLSFFTPPGATSPLMILAPGDAGASCVYYRMSTRTGVDDAAVGIQMPPIDTHKVDEAGVSIIQQWIDQGCQ